MPSHEVTGRASRAVYAAIRNYLDEPALTLDGNDTLAGTLGFDSLDMAGLLDDLASDTGIDIKVKDLRARNVVTVGDLIDDLAVQMKE